MTFKELDLLEPILNSLDNQGYSNPTTIQEQAIPIVIHVKVIM
jgi:ATP-dependent RNA helicase RhlE